MKWKWILNNKGLFDIIPGLQGLSPLHAITEALKPPASPASTAPPVPNQSAASAAASTSVNTSRAALLASGGQTDETGGLGILTGSDVANTSLIGG